MRYQPLLALVLPLLLIGGCEPLPEKEQQVQPDNLGFVPLDSLPAEYGQLVAVTPHFGRSGPSDWYELWFSEPVSGRVTLVQVWRPGMSYPASAVVVIDRAPSAAPPVTPQSTP
jgi:hypothetical protein